MMRKWWTETSERFARALDAVTGESLRVWPLTLAAAGDDNLAADLIDQFRRRLTLVAGATKCDAVYRVG